MRGAPGAGKSTWIKENNLEDYTLCPDQLRTLCATKELMPDGSFKITQDQRNEKAVWEVLFKILEHRMSRGEFTVIDATCSKTKDIQQYRDLAEHYRYRTFIIDFTSVPLETCLKQNKMRPEYKWVPDNAIKNIYARFATQSVPARIKVIKPNEFNTLLETPFEVSSYRKLVFIGDIHGCYDTLMQYKDFKKGLQDDTEYIFLGDFLDRGNQNVETIHFINSLIDKPNVCLVEGNHEIHIQAYGDGNVSKSTEFELKTKPQLIAGGFTEKMARMFYRKVKQFSHLTFHGVEILACHGGIPTLDTNLLFIPTYKFIKGAGGYSEYITNAETWMSRTNDNCYLIHGHRNTEGSPTQMADRVFNLEGRVEYGGSLRIVECEYKDNQVLWSVVELPDCQPINEDLNITHREIETIEDAVIYLRNNRFVNEKELGNNISSFNFTREAFLKRNWNKQTVLARGLFIDTLNNKIMARSYEKFFRIEETSETELPALKDNLKFPIQAYVKENGFLAIVSYDYNKDDLFIASKSTNKGEYVEYIKTQLKPYSQKLLSYLKNMEPNVSLVFECIDIENDPHIVKYDKNNLVLLDVIKNDLKYEPVSYEKLVEIAKLLNCSVKEKAFTLTSWKQFRELYSKVQNPEYKHNEKYIEGFVFVDANGFMTKCKTAYYNEWKKLRGVAVQTLRCGYITRTGILQNVLENEFYGFLTNLYKNYYNREEKTYPFKTDIISLRDKFLGE